MPVPRGSKQDAATIAQLKLDYLDYYKDCPHQKLGAMFIGRNEDTIIGWRKADPEFSEKILQAEARFARKELMKTNADWKLARLFAPYFREPDQNVNVKMIPILGGLTREDVPSDNGDQEDSQAPQAD